MTAIFALKNNCAVMFIRDDAKLNRDDAINEANVMAMAPEKREHARNMQRIIKEMTFPYTVAIDANDFARNVLMIKGDTEEERKATSKRIENWHRGTVSEDEWTSPEVIGITITNESKERNSEQLLAKTAGFGSRSDSLNIEGVTSVTAYSYNDNIVIDPRNREPRHVKASRSFIKINGIYQLSNHLLKELSTERANAIPDEIKTQVQLYNRYLSNLGKFATKIGSRMATMVVDYLNDKMESRDVLMAMDRHELIELIKDLRRDNAVTHDMLIDQRGQLDTANQKLDTANQKLDEANLKLDTANQKLKDANQSLNSMRGALELVRDHLRIMSPENTDSYGIMIRFDKLKPSPNDPRKNIKYRLTFQVGLDRRIHEAYYYALKRDKPLFIGTYLGLDNHQIIFNKLVKENKLRNMKEKSHSGKRFIIPDRNILDKVVQKLCSIVQIKDQVENKMAAALDPEPDEIVDLMSCISDDSDEDNFEEFNPPEPTGYLHILMYDKLGNLKIFFKEEQNPESISTIKRSKYHMIPVYTNQFDVLTWFKFTISNTIEVDVNKAKDALMIRKSSDLFDRFLLITSA